MYLVCDISRRPQHLLVNSRRPRPIASPHGAFGTARFLQHQVPTHSMLIRSQEAAPRSIGMAALSIYETLRRFFSRTPQWTRQITVFRFKLLWREIYWLMVESIAPGSPSPHAIPLFAEHHATTHKRLRCDGCVPNAVCAFVDGCRVCRLAEPIGEVFEALPRPSTSISILCSCTLRIRDDRHVWGGCVEVTWNFSSSRSTV